MRGFLRRRGAASPNADATPSKPVEAARLNSTSRGLLVGALLAGVLSAVTGFTSAFAIVIAGLQAAGATDQQAASGLLMLCVGQGATAIVLSIRYRMPLSFAWSTPGAALLVASQHSDGDFRIAVGAFITCGALIFATGIWSGLAGLVARIPRSLSGALLAGILLPICAAPALAVVDRPLVIAPIVLVWLIFVRIKPTAAVPAAMLATVVVVLVTVNLGELPNPGLIPVFEWIPPRWDPVVMLSLGVPLFIVTMAGQNVPGLAVLSTMGYENVPVRQIFMANGLVGAAGSFGGGHVINLAAITAAMVAGPGAHPDPNRRWIASTATGVTYLVLGLAAGWVTTIATAAPEGLITAVAGLALLGAFSTALVSAIEHPPHRLGAVVTLVVAASGFVALGVGAALWGLIAGAIVLWSTSRSLEDVGGPTTLNESR